MERMTATHSRGVIEIYNHYISQGKTTFLAQTLPLDAGMTLLAQSAGLPAAVHTLSGGQVVGFGMLKPFGAAALFGHTAEVCTYVHPDHLRQGIGSALLRWLEEEGEKAGIVNFLASIRSENAASIAFHQRHGFGLCGCFSRIGCAEGKTFDVLWYQKQIKKEA